MASITKGETAYTIHVEDGREAGHVNFVDIDSERFIYHTETKPEFRGRGYASKLVASLLHDTADAGIPVVAVCPFVSGWFAHNPDEIDMEWRMPTSSDSAKLREALRLQDR